MNAKTKISLGVAAIGLLCVAAMCATLQASTAGQPSAASRIEPQQGSDQGVALMRVANPFAGTYCGSLGFSYVGSITISDSGRVSGFFDGGHDFVASLELKGRITAEGVMRLRVVDSFTDGGFSATERYSVTLSVALDESGNLVGTWVTTPFVWSPCQ